MSPRPAEGAVVVTGASTGIGRALSVSLAAAGWRVFGGVRRELDAAALAREGVEPLRLDVTDDASVRDAVATLERSLGPAPLAALVNNAGIATFGPLEQVPAAEVQRLFDVNVVGVARVTAALLPRLRAARGRIVMMSSVSACFAAPFFGLYSASKAALEALADGLRREVAPHGVSVVIVEPGPIRTPIWEKFSREQAEHYLAGPYGGRFGPMLRRMEEAARGAEEPAAVTRAVTRALTSSRPPLRIMVTRRRWLHRLLRALPARAGDVLVGR